MNQVAYKTDHAWVKALMDGNVAAWGEVPNPEGNIGGSGLLGMLYRWARRDVHDPDQAKDIAMEAGSQVLRHLGSFRGEAPFEAWLRQVYRSVLYKHAPGSQYKVRSKLERWLQSVERRGLEQQRAAERALQRLLPEERHVVAMVKQGHNTAQIATDLKLSVPLVRALKNQSLSKLLANPDFMAMLIRVGNRDGSQKDKLAANIVAAHQALQETSLEALIRSEDTEEGESDIWDKLLDPKTLPEATMSDWLARFWECLDRLPAAKKAVIQLTWRYRVQEVVGGNIDERIAQELSITPQLVRLRRFQAKGPLKRCLEDR